MITVAVVEDTSADFACLKEFIKRYEVKYGRRIEVNRFSSAAELLNGYRGVYDIIFMDVRLPGTDGISAAEKLREIDGESLIIFFTTMAQLAVKGYSVEAFDYLVKPLDYNTFKLSFDRALKAVDKKSGKKLTVTTADGVEIISSSDVLYIEVFDHRLVYHTATRNISSWGSLKKLETGLKDSGFVRCNNCYLVNLKYVRKCDADVIVVGGQELKVSKTGMKAVMDALLEYIE